MPEIALWFAIGSLICSGIAAFFTWAAWRSAVRNSVASVTVQKLAWIEAELLETRDLIAGLEHSIRKLRSRMYVRKRRDEADDSEPVPQDRDALKKHLREKAGLHLTAGRK